MINYRYLLCPIDFSDISDHAFQIARDLAERFEAELHVIHVFQLPATAFPEGVYEAPEYMEARIEEQLANRLEEFVKNNPSSKINITTGLYEGIPHVEIIRSADENKADMIVMGWAPTAEPASPCHLRQRRGTRDTYVEYSGSYG